MTSGLIANFSYEFGMQGCAYVVASFGEYMVNRSKVIVLLVEAIGESPKIIVNGCLLYMLSFYSIASIEFLLYCNFL